MSRQWYSYLIVVKGFECNENLKGFTAATGISSLVGQISARPCYSMLGVLREGRKLFVKIFE
jgi:hypothetical protein